MQRQYRRYSEEFKREVIEYSMNNTKPIKQICKEFNTSNSQFYAWKNKILEARATPAFNYSRTNSTRDDR